LGETVVSPPRPKPSAKEREFADDEPAPISLSRFLRPLGQALASRSSSDADDDDDFDPTFLNGDAKGVARTLRLSERSWPAQREALRARAEAGARRWWLPGGLLALLAGGVGLLVAAPWRRAPAPFSADASASAAPAAPPSNGPAVAPAATVSAAPAVAPVASEPPPGPRPPTPGGPSPSPDHHAHPPSARPDVPFEAPSGAAAGVDPLAERDDEPPGAPSARPPRPVREVGGVDGEAGGGPSRPRPDL
jgi:hypothetical protein